MKTIKRKTLAAGPRGVEQVGAVVEVSDAEADQAVRQGAAEYVTARVIFAAKPAPSSTPAPEPEVETAEAPEPEEQAVSKRGRARRQRRRG